MPYRKKEFVRPDYQCKDGRKCIICWNGSKIYLGPWDGRGTPPTAVLQKYLRTVVELQQEWEAEQLGILPPDPEHSPSIAEAVLEYLQYLESEPHPEGCRMPDGTTSDTFRKTKRRLQPLVALYGDTLAEKFAAADLRTLRRAMLAGSWRTTQDLNSLAKHGRKAGWGPEYVNSTHGTIMGMFRFLEAQGRIKEGKAAHLDTLKRLTVSAPAEKSTVADADFWAVVNHTSPMVAVLLQVQRLTAARPSELTIMRPVDIDRSRKVWVYSPYDHKTKHHKKTRPIPLGDECQRLLAPLLDGRPLDQYVFRPAEAGAWWRAHRSQEAAAKPRKTKVYPCEIKRRAKKKAERSKKSDDREFAEHYTRHTLRGAVRHAVKKANARGVPCEYWNPYAIRHTRITEVEHERGWEDAQAVAGHETLSMTKLYAHKRQERAIRIAGEAQSKESSRRRRRP